MLMYPHILNSSNLQINTLQKYHCVVAGQTLPGQLGNASQHITKHAT